MTKSLPKDSTVTWNSEVGKVKGSVEKKVTTDTTFKGRKRHATKDDPQYIVKSEKSGKTAMHKAKALKKS
jgi:hypothetical protein